MGKTKEGKSPAKPKPAMFDKPSKIKYTGSELCKLSAVEAVSLLRKGKVSPLELIKAAFERIEQTDGAVNAMPILCRDRALKFGKNLEKTKGKELGFLAGLPIAIKDLNNVKGVHTTYGSIGFKDNIAKYNDPLVDRLEKRDGIIIGKTNTPEFGAGGNTFNAVFGNTRNPWNTSKNAGGSSGGAAVSLACGQVWLSHGSDLAGSLRTPAAYCGVVGFRPSPGITGPGPTGLGFHTEGVQGPMARNVLDCALFLDAMAGFNPDWAISFPPPEEGYLAITEKYEKKLPRIAFSVDLNNFTFTDKIVSNHLKSVMGLLEKCGAKVEETCPKLTQLDESYRVLRAMLWASRPGKLPQSKRKYFKETLADNINAGRKLTINQVYNTQIARSELFDTMVNLFKNFDVLACPVVGLMPGPVDVPYPPEINGKPADYIEWLKFSFLSTTTTLPSVSIPVGFSKDGMPIGLQLIGGPRQEARLLQVARFIESSTDCVCTPIDPSIK